MEQWPQIRHKSVYNVVSNEVKLRIVNIVNIPVSAKAMATIQPCWMDRSIVFLSPDHSFVAIDRHCAFFFFLLTMLRQNEKKEEEKGRIYMPRRTHRISSKISGFSRSLCFILSFIAVMMLFALSSAPCFELFSAAPEKWKTHEWAFL